jgi:hypothetical protein
MGKADQRKKLNPTEKAWEYGASKPPMECYSLPNSQDFRSGNRLNCDYGSPRGDRKIEGSSLTGFPSRSALRSSLSAGMIEGAAPFNGLSTGVQNSHLA